MDMKQRLKGTAVLPRQRLKAERVQEPQEAAAPADGGGFILALHPQGVEGVLELAKRLG